MPPTWPPDEQLPPVDESQKEAAEAFRQYGKIIVEAPPGTGKTFLGAYLSLCAYRLGWASKTTPALFLTFSKNARVQIEQEIQRFRKNVWITSDEEKSIKVYNYHAFFYEQIQKKAGVWGRQGKLHPTSILENKTRLQSLLPAQVQNDPVLAQQASLVLALQRFQIGDLLTRGTQLTLDNETIQHIQEATVSALRSGSLQYDDFAPLFLNLLEICPEFTEWLRIKYPVIILDEFQDTDIVQWEIVKKINPNRSVLLYDRFQMIYEWRGARLERLEQVKKHLGIGPQQEKQLIHIHRYNAQANFAQFIQQLRVDQLLGGSVTAKRYRPWLTIQPIQPLANRPIIPYENRCLSWFRYNSRIIDLDETTAIITRYNFLAEHLFRHLRVRPNKGAFYPCRWIGGDDNPDEKVRDWIWGLKQLNSDMDLRVWLGSVLDEVLPLKILRELNVLFSSEFSKDESQFFAGRKSETLKRIRSNWLPFWGTITRENFRSMPVWLNQILVTARDIVERNGYLDADLVYYIGQLKHSIDKFQPEKSDGEWQEFCYHLESAHLKASYLKLRNPNGGLYILTIHQSKGREFDHVIIPWLSGKGEPLLARNGGRYNSALAFDQLEDRKLMYVALTRAKKRVTIIYPQEAPSPFLINWKLINP